MAVVLADIYASFPEFDLTDRTGMAPVANPAQDALVTVKLAEAVAFLDRTLFKDSTTADQATKYLTAHRLALAQPAVYARLQKSRGDDRLVTNEDVYFETFKAIAQGACGGALVV